MDFLIEMFKRFKCFCEMLKKPFTHNVKIASENNSTTINEGDTTINEYNSTTINEGNTTVNEYNTTIKYAIVFL